MTEKINIDPVWEEKYASGHQEKYPWDIVVSFVFRNRPRQKFVHDTHVGTSKNTAGSNLWFAAREGFQVAGVEGSLTAVNHGVERFEQEGLTGDLRHGDFTSLPFGESSFDLAIDRCSLACVGKQMQKKAIAEVRRCLRPGGRFLFNGYSDNHSSARSGSPGLDGLISNISEGTLTGVGSLAFISRTDIEEFFSEGWLLLSVQRREYTDMLNPLGGLHCEWVVVSEKTHD